MQDMLVKYEGHISKQARKEYRCICRHSEILSCGGGGEHSTLPGLTAF